MFTSNTFGFFLFSIISLSANAAESGLRVLDLLDSAVDTSRGLAAAYSSNPILYETGTFEKVTVTSEDRLIINYADFSTQTLAPGVYDAATAMPLTDSLFRDAVPSRPSLLSHLLASTLCAEISEKTWLRVGALFGKPRGLRRIRKGLRHDSFRRPHPLYAAEPAPCDAAFPAVLAADAGQ